MTCTSYVRRTTAMGIVLLWSGDPTMFESFWIKNGQKSTTVILGWQVMSYMVDVSNICWFLEPELAKEIRSLHSLVGNAVTKGRHIVIGTGSTQLFQAALYALSPRDHSKPTSVVSAAPYYSGWKLSDMMFATRRSLSDACTSVSKQLEQVSTSIAAAKRHLSSRIDQVDNNLNECAELNAATKDEDVTNQGVYHLCEFVQKLEQRKQSELIQASSSSPRLAIEQPPSGSGSSSSVKGPSSSPRALEQRMGASRSGSGLKEVQGISEAVKASTPHTSDPTVGEDELKGNSTNSSMFGWKLPGLNPAFLQRSRSATGSFNKGISPRT